MEPDGLFVYGTLREGGANRAWLLRTRPEGTTRAWTPGRLFHLPEAGFPILVATPVPGTTPPGPGWVLGEFVGYEDEVDLARALEDLDQLEGVGEDLFTRRVVPIVLEGGQRYGAWAYVFLPDRLPRLEREGIELLEGDWESYL